MQKNNIQILIAYDQQLIADGLAAILSGKNDFNVIDTINNEDLISKHVEEFKPDIVLFEFARWPKHYIEYIKEFSQLFQNSKILILSELIPHDSLVKIMSFVNGYILRTCSSDSLIRALHEVYDLGKYLCPKEMKEFFKIKEPTKNTKLTVREEEVLSTWLDASDNKIIAEKLHVSESTVRTHLKNVKEKIGSANKIQMLIYACRNNILKSGKKPICPNCKFFCNKRNIVLCN